MGPYQFPALTRLAANKGLAGFALSVERIEVLPYALFGRFAGINGAAPQW
jgi:hypothetical protein